MKKIEWKKNIWEFIKKFPAVSYGVINIAIFIIVAVVSKLNISSFIMDTKIVSFLIAPFIPGFLICAGLGNVIPHTTFTLIDEVLPLIIFLLILLFLDLVILLLRKLSNQYLGKNLFTKFSLIAITVLLWAYVFLRLINSLPIDV